VSAVPVTVYAQLNQPPGVPPLALDGERTLPDVPAENYWFRRHLAVYEWIALSATGARVLDMACGEGYGAATLAAAGALSAVGVDANPEAYEHARLRYSSPGLSFERGLAESWGEPGSYDLITFLQTIEHVHDPQALLAHLRSLLARGGAAYISTPNLLTLAPAGAEKSDNPWHIREYRAHEFRSLCESAFESVQLFGLYHARKLALHERALRLGWDRVHKGLRISRPFYDWFTPAIDARDFVLSDIRPLGTALDFVAVCR
jgi:SAM-dependent methyltransferase